MRARSALPEDLEIAERYDSDSDVYYVTVRTGEPSIVQEHDDRMLIEVGIFTKLPTGFRVLNYSKLQTEVGIFKRVFLEQCKRLGLQRIKQTSAWTRQFDKALHEELAQVEES